MQIAIQQEGPGCHRRNLVPIARKGLLELAVKLGSKD